MQDLAQYSWFYIKMTEWQENLTTWSLIVVTKNDNKMKVAEMNSLVLNCLWFLLATTVVCYKGTNIGNFQKGNFLCGHRVLHLMLVYNYSCLLMLHPSHSPPLSWPWDPPDLADLSWDCVCLSVWALSLLSVQALKLDALRIADRKTAWFSYGPAWVGISVH